MPKTNDQTGATYAGNEGVVEHGAPIEGGRILSEIDPERNLDGSLIEGDHPDHQEPEVREFVSPTDPRPITPPRGQEADEDEPDGVNPDRSTGPVRGKGAAQDESSDAATPNTVKPGTRAGTRK